MSKQQRAVDVVQRFLFQRSFRHRECSHLEQVKPHALPDLVCPRCEVEGTKPVHIRMCLLCGEAGCCDSSKAKHARRHFEETGHPLIRSIEPGEVWGWCYLDKAYIAGLAG